MLFLTLDDIIESHQNQIDTYGGSHGIRESVWLNLPSFNPRQASAFSTCTQTFLKWLPLIFITTYLYHLVMNHPFVDGNKRVGLEAALIFLEINDKSLIANDDELVDLVLKTTAGQIGKREIAEFFRSHCM